jgi:uncharacterized protein (DUF1499 family)
LTQRELRSFLETGHSSLIANEYRPEVMRTVITLLTAGVLVAVAIAFLYRETLWVLVAGPADLGPVDFATLNSRSPRNSYLACPQTLCVQAAPDMSAPVYRLGAAQLQATAREAWAAEPGLEIVDSNPDRLQDRYVQRTPVMRFPDTISVRFVDLEDSRSTLAIYSRSQIGRTDLGKNKDRVLRWILLLSERVPENRSVH